MSYAEEVEKAVSRAQARMCLAMDVERTAKHLVAHLKRADFPDLGSTKRLKRHAEKLASHARRCAEEAWSIVRDLESGAIASEPETNPASLDDADESEAP